MVLRKDTWFYVLLAGGLLLTFFAVRLAGILSFPLFIDETTHIELGDRVLHTGPLYNAWLGRLFTGWVQAGVQSYAQAPVWSARIITLLMVLPGYAALLALGRLFAGRWGMLLAGLLVLLSTYHLFFERMALADPPSASLALVALWVAARLHRRWHGFDAALSGALLFVAFAFKISILPYMCVPVLAGLTLGRYTWVQRLRWLAITLAVMLGLTGAFVLGLRLLGEDYLSNSVSLGLTGRAQQSGLEILLNNLHPAVFGGRIVALGQLFAGYWGVPVLVLTVLALGRSIWQRRWYLVGGFLLPALVMWFNLTQETRYWLPPASLLLLLLAIVAAQWLQHQRRGLHWVVLGAVLVWGATLWLPFWLAGLHPQPELPLPQWDRDQYVLSDASGYGVVQAGAYLLTVAPDNVLGIVANCLTLRYTYLHQLEVTCPRIAHDGSSIEALAALMQDNQHDGVYAVLEAIDYLPDSAPGMLVTTIERPLPGPRLEIYHLGGVAEEG